MQWDRVNCRWSVSVLNFFFWDRPASKLDSALVVSWIVISTFFRQGSLFLPSSYSKYVLFVVAMSTSPQEVLFSQQIADWSRKRPRQLLLNLNNEAVYTEGT